MCKDLFNIKKMANILLKDICELVYVADPRTYEILYVNKKLEDVIDAGPILHNKCYEVLQGRSTPCAFCTNPILLNSTDKSYSWEYYNPVMDKFFLIKDKIIKWDDGRDVRLEYALDISHLKNMENKLKKRLSLERLINDISNKFIGVFDFKHTINDALKRIGDYTRASRVYIFSITDGMMNNTFEWCADGVASEMWHLQGLPTKDYKWWINLLEEQGVINIDDIEKIQDSLVEKHILKFQQIKSLLVFPTYRDSKINGFIGIDYIIEKRVWNQEDMSLLHVTSQIIGNAIERHYMELKLRESERDYKDIFENTGRPSVIIDRKRRVTLANEEFFRLTGYEKKSIKDRMLTELFYTVDYGRIKSCMDSMKGGNQYKNIRIKVLGRLQRPIDVLISINKIEGSNRFMMSFIKYVTDDEGSIANVNVK